MEAICAHLEAISRGEFALRGMLPYVIFNVPPGSSKSLLVSVLWQAWEWGPMKMAHTRWLTTSYSDTPVSRDSRKARDLMRTDWYQTLWPHVRLTRTGETDFSNTAKGERKGAAFGSLTSQRGDRFILDDPHSTETAESAVQRASTIRKFREGALNRLNDQQRSAFVIIMQRLHFEDITGVALKLGIGFTHVCYPMEYEAARRTDTPWFKDPRQTEGELLDPTRFPESICKVLQVGLGSYGWAGQYQQRPSPRDGGLFKRSWFDGKIIRPSAVPPGTRWVRHWDLAATAATTAARTAGVKMGRTTDGRIIVAHSATAQIEGAEVRKLIKATAEVDGRQVEISLPQDPGQAGKTQAKDMIAMLAGYVARAIPESGDKVTRAEPFSAQCEAGNVFLVEGPWNEPYLDELCLFPGGSYADQVDASSGAFSRLVMKREPVLTGAIVVTGSVSHIGDHPDLARGG